MRQAEKEKKTFYFRIPLKLDSGKKIPKKIAKKLKKLKNLFPTLFLAKRDEIGREKGKKIILPNSVRTRPRLENSEKNDKKILIPIAVHTRPGEENSERNSKKIEKI